MAVEAAVIDGTAPRASRSWRWRAAAIETLRRGQVARCWSGIAGVAGLDLFQGSSYSLVVHWAARPCG